jgi:hypothetical protein
MNKKKLREWAMLAEIVGGTAVIFSLIFVGLQIRQSSIESSLNTRAIEVSAYQGLSAQINTIAFEGMIEPEISQMVIDVYQNKIPATFPIDGQINFYLAYTTRHSDMVHNQFKNELITDVQLYSMFNPLRRNLSSDIGKLYWDTTVRVNTAYTDEFVSFVEEHMRKLEPNEPFWRKAE